jgi:hypothetical protein
MRLSTFSALRRDREQYKSEYLSEFEIEFEKILGCESGAHMGSIIEKKTRGRQSRATVPLTSVIVPR